MYSGKVKKFSILCYKNNVKTNQIFKYKASIVYYIAVWVALDFSEQIFFVGTKILLGVKKKLKIKFLIDFLGKLSFFEEGTLKSNEKCCFIGFRAKNNPSFKNFRSWWKIWCIWQQYCLAENLV